MDSSGHPSGRPAQQGDLASRLEILNGLLNTLTDVLDIRDVFDQVSQVVQSILPHDIMGVVEVSEKGDRIRRHAGTVAGESYEAAVPNPEILMQFWDAGIVENFPSHPLAKGSPPLKLGMATLLSAPIRFGGRLQEP